MTENKRNLLAAALFLLGALLALLLVVMSFWPDMEARLFAPAQTAEARLTALRCPLVVTPADEAQITAAFRNAQDRDLRLLVVAHISEGHLTLMRETRTLLRLAPGGKETLSWAVAPEDAVYGRVIMARVHQFRTFPYPSRERACGILFLNLPWLTGGQWVWLLGGLTLLCLGGGAWLWLGQERPLPEARRKKALNVGVLTAVLLAAFLAGLLGAWFVSLMLLLFMALLFISILESWPRL